jgi:acyl-homoserine-lactone acylase
MRAPLRPPVGEGKRAMFHVKPRTARGERLSRSVHSASLNLKRGGQGEFVLLWTKRIAAGLAVLVVAALAYLLIADIPNHAPAPNLSALIARAKSYDVRIRRDSFGVPHVLGKRDADVAFGFAFAHSEDDFATMQDAVLTSRGTLASEKGYSGAVTDYLVHLFRVHELIDARYAHDLPADVRRVLEAYADGVNYYAALHPDKVAAGLLPVTGKDVDAGFVFRTPFFYGLDDVMRHITSVDDGKAQLPIGSNGVAVAPSRNADGATRLLVNSHQPYVGQVSWYEAVLESREGWHVAGGFFPGSPFMLHGHNAHLGWANTVDQPNLVTVYRLTINPDDSSEYKLDGVWKHFETSDAKIRIKLIGPLYYTFHKAVEWSVHGPVFRTDHGVFALRYAGMNEIRQPEQYYRLDKAANVGEWRAALGLQELPSINYIYADEKGNIGYVYNGLFPNRRGGIDWMAIQPGDRSDLIWHGYLPFARVPQIWNPKSGLVFNSNNTPFEATDLPDRLKPSDFPVSMGLQTNMTNRAYRAEETFGQDHAMTDASFRAHKFDLAYSVRSKIAQLIAQILAIDSSRDDDLKAAQNLLRNWDRRTDAKNRATALAVMTGLKAVRSDNNPTPLAPLDALHQAIATLKEHFGRIDPEWGQVNRFRRGKLDVPIDGGPDVFRAVYGVPQDDGTFTAVDGDTLIMFVTWDRAGHLSSQSIHQFGSATLDETSPHYADQSPLFVAMKTKPVLFTEDELKGHVEADYRPGETHGP